MTQDEIIEMARQAGFERLGHTDDDWVCCTEELEVFAKLVRNHYSYTHAHLWLTRIEGAVKAEREACAKLCDDINAEYEAKDVFSSYAEAIRERGQA